MRKVFGFFAFLIFVFATTNIRAAELQIFAAASLTDALQTIGASYEKQTANKLFFNFAASSILARQIEEGAPTDLFFSADEEKMDFLQKKGLILKETRKSLLSNTLVIVVAFDSKVSLDSPVRLAKSSWKIALAEPQTVPAGIYAKEYLKKIGIWNQVIDRVIPTENVRAALAAVESGNVDVGIVYKTDANISKRVKIVHEIPAQEGSKISYPLAVVAESKQVDEARKLADYLASPESIAIFRKCGFLIQE